MTYPDGSIYERWSEKQEGGVTCLSGDLERNGMSLGECIEYEKIHGSFPSSERQTEWEKTIKEF